MVLVSKSSSLEIDCVVCHNYREFLALREMRVIQEMIFLNHIYINMTRASWKQMIFLKNTMKTWMVQDKY